MDFFHTQYETDTDVGCLLDWTQAEAFVNKGKGIPVPGVVMDKLAAELPVVKYVLFTTWAQHNLRKFRRSPVRALTFVYHTSRHHSIPWAQYQRRIQGRDMDEGHRR